MLQLQRGCAVKAWPLVALAWCFVLACAARATAPSQTPAPPPTMPSSPHDQIQQLSDQIDTDRARMALAEPPPQMPMSATAQPMGEVPSSHDAACHHGTSQTCGDSCNLSDSICTSAKKICDLASGLANDKWAAEKCDRGKTTCAAAQAKCCSCQP